MLSTGLLVLFSLKMIEVNTGIRPQCVLCAAVLSDEALKPAKLESNLKTNQANLNHRPSDFFPGKVENLKKK